SWSSTPSISQRKAFEHKSDVGFDRDDSPPSSTRSRSSVYSPRDSGCKTSDYVLRGSRLLVHRRFLSSDRVHGIRILGVSFCCGELLSVRLFRSICKRLLICQKMTR